MSVPILAKHPKEMDLTLTVANVKYLPIVLLELALLAFAIQTVQVLLLMDISAIVLAMMIAHLDTAQAKVSVPILAQLVKELAPILMAATA